MYTTSTPYFRPLGDGLNLKSVSSEADIDRLATFNGAIHGNVVGPMTKALILHHPNTSLDQWLYIEDESTGQIVSSLCLIPWRWRYGGVELRSAEMGVCGTLESYRNRGLVRLLMNRYKELLREGEFDLSHIQGIPYFYRQFGYEYALPLVGGWEIEPRQIPDELSQGYNRRLATVEDIPTLMRLRAEAMRDLDLYAERNTDEWRYLLQHSRGTATELDVFLLNSGEQPIGYWFVEHHGFGEGLNINEVSRLDHATAKGALGQLKQLAEERQKPYIRLSVPDDTALIKTAAGMGARDQGRYQWQIHIPDVSRLLRKIAPVLKERIANSMFKGLTQTIQLNLYRETFALPFENGTLKTVESLGFTGSWETRIPPLLFAPLVLGWRTHEELSKIYPDFSASADMKPLIHVLFPRMNSFIYTIY